MLIEDITVDDFFFARTSRYELRVDVYFCVRLSDRRNDKRTGNPSEAETLVRSINRLSAVAAGTLAVDYHTNLYISMFEDEPSRIEFGSFRVAHKHRRTITGIPLDEYLIPYYTREAIEKSSESIMTEWEPEMLSDSSKISAAALANAMGLKIISLPLFKRKQTASILFFRDGEVLIKGADDEPQSVMVEAKTIVLNDYFDKNMSAATIAIFHECYHYAEHYMFFRLQQMYNNDLARLATWKPKDETVIRLASGRNERKRNSMGPMRGMEYQAKLGGFCLCMPGSLVKPKIRSGLSLSRQGKCHAGMALENICRKLAVEFRTPNYCARYRAISMGYTAAKGALNYVDDHYIRPFAFSLEACKGNYTFVVTAKEIVGMYLRDRSFRELIDTGRYIYVDGHLCVDSEMYIAHKDTEPTMTHYGNAHVDECCLRFKVNFTLDERSEYVYGQLNSDREYNDRFLTYDQETEGMNIVQQAKFYTELMATLPRTAHETIVAHIRRLDISTEQLAERCDLSDSTIKRIRRGDKTKFTLEQSVILCIGLHLPYVLSTDVLKKTKNELDDSDAVHMVYRLILQSFYLLPLEQIQKMLTAEQLPELKFTKAS